MTTILNFLNEASKDVNLQIFREETEAKQRVKKIAPALEEKLDDFAAVDGEETEEVGDEPGGFPAKPIRRQSKALLDMLHRFEPRLKCENSDTACLLMYVANNVKAFDFQRDLTKLTFWLKTLAEILNHIMPSSSSLRNLFVEFTSIFKSYWIDRGETNKNGYHVDVVRNILRAPASRVAAVLAEKEARLRSKLGDKYFERWEDVSRICLELYDRGMAAGADRKDMFALLLSLCLSTGARKTAWIDPNVTFTTYSAFKASETKAGRTAKLSIGITNGDEDEDLIDIGSDEKYDEQVGFEQTIVQVGVLKDSETQINKYLDDDDDRHVAARILIKPTIILTAKQVVDGVRKFRKYFNLTKANFQGRKKEGNRFGTNDLGPLMQQNFPRAYAKSKANKWEFSSHYCRKVYSAAAFHIYSPQIQRLSGKYIDRSIFSAAILGHGSNSLGTSLSYANVVVEFGFTDDALKVPAEHQIRLLMAKNAFLESEMKELKTMFSEFKTAKRENVDSNLVLFTNEAKETVYLTKRAKTNFKSTADRDSAVKTVIDELKKNKITPTVQNVTAMGVGRQTFADYKKRKGLEKKKDAAVETEAAAVAGVINDRALKPGGVSTAELPVGSKVIAVTNPKASDNTKKQQMKRAIETFGEENVIKSAEDCSGQINKKQKITTSKGTTLVRDVCEDKR
jgi:hypothetical protein